MKTKRHELDYLSSSKRAKPSPIAPNDEQELSVSNPNLLPSNDASSTSRALAQGADSSLVQGLQTPRQRAWHALLQVQQQQQQQQTPIASTSSQQLPQHPLAASYLQGQARSLSINRPYPDPRSDLSDLLALSRAATSTGGPTESSSLLLRSIYEAQQAQAQQSQAQASNNSMSVLDRLLAQQQQRSFLDQLLAQHSLTQQQPSLSMQLAALAAGRGPSDASNNNNNTSLQLDYLLAQHKQQLQQQQQQQLFQSQFILGEIGHSLSDTALRQLASSLTPGTSILPSSIDPLSASLRTNGRLNKQQQQQQQLLSKNKAAGLPKCDTVNTDQTGVLVSFEGDELRPVSLPSEPWVMSEYQCFLRQQIVFCASQARDNGGKTQGRNKPIVPGQVGILCRHCARLPPRNRPRGAVYYPARLHRIYQAAQNMAHNHFAVSCQSIPAEAKERLLGLKEQKVVTVGAGKEYWLSAAMTVGVREREDEGGLYFEKNTSDVAASSMNEVKKTKEQPEV